MRATRNKGFDPRPAARATLKERICWMLYMGGLFFLLYGSANQLAALSAALWGPHPCLAMDWERHIPFVEAMIIPYMSSDLVFCLTFLLPHSRLGLRVLAARVLVLMLLSTALFLLFPLRFGMERPPVEHFTALFTLLGADLPYNQAPSLHVGFTVVLWASIRGHLQSWQARAAVLGWFGLIVLSTLLVYQHHVIDIPTGFAAGLLALAAVPRDRAATFPLTRGFMSPRHLKMALYHLAGSAAAVVLAFHAPPALAWLPAWIGLSQCLVSLAYAFGLPGLLAGRRGRAGLVRWLFLAPHYLGSHLAWLWYLRDLPLVAEAGAGVFFGRLPGSHEAGVLRALGIGSRIDLAPEQQVGRPDLEGERLAWLDMVLQDPRALHQAVRAIEARRGEGVFVHCSLGLSRTVLAVSAWLLFRGLERARVEALMDRLRPGRVRSPYMRLSLDIYEEFLHNGQERAEGAGRC